MALVPFPAATDTEALKTATAALNDALGALPTEEAYGDRTRWEAVLQRETVALQRLARTVSARVERYAPGAPQDVKDEALIRAVAWLDQTTGSGVVTGRTIGPRSWSVDVRAPSGWFRYSSAQSLLSPWRARNAGLVEEAS